VSIWEHIKALYSYSDFVLGVWMERVVQVSMSHTVGCGMHTHFVFQKVVAMFVMR